VTLQVASLYPSYGTFEREDGIYGTTPGVTGVFTPLQGFKDAYYWFTACTPKQGGWGECTIYGNCRIF
jgi:hypothetical protein